MGQEVKGEHPTSDVLLGFMVAADVVYTALVNKPSPEIVADVCNVGRILDIDSCESFEANQELEQRYYDRFYVPTSPYFIPLVENSIREACSVGVHKRYGSTKGMFSREVLASYQALHFNYKALPGDEVAVRSLKPDSLASEIAFMSALADKATAGDSPNPAASAAALRLLGLFAREHPQRWFWQAENDMRAVDDDFYAFVVRIAAIALDSLVCVSKQN